MNSIHWNCRGFYAKYEEVELMLSSYKPKVVCLQETYHTDTRPVKVKGYASFNTGQPHNPDRATGGISILVSNSTPYSSQHHTSGASC